MSKTPRTDVAARYIEGFADQWVPRYVSEELERELKESREYVDKLAQGLPDGMLPKDVEVLREANCGLALELTAVTEERDEARDALSEISLYLSVGIGDESTTAQQYYERIIEGIAMLTRPIMQRLDEAREQRDMPAEHIREAANDLHAAFFVMRHDWKDGDFDLPPLARIHMEAMECKAIELGKLLFRRQNITL